MNHPPFRLRHPRFALAAALVLVLIVALGAEDGDRGRPQLCPQRRARRPADT